MGRIVAACATSHVVMDPTPVRAQAQRVIEGFQRIAAEISRTAPDVILYITSDHMVNLGYRLQPAFALGCADSYTPLGDMDIPREPMAGAGVFADGLLRYLDGAGFDLARAETLDPDHGIALPLRIINPGGRIPVAPLLININRTPAPTPARCYALGQAIGEYIRSAVCPQRVAVIGAGGLGHIGIQCLKAMCAADVIVVDKSDASLALAGKMGADKLVKADGNEVEAVLQLTQGEGAEAVIDFVGEKGTTSKGLAMTRPAGSYYVVGYGEDIQIPTVDMVITEKNIIGNLVGTWAELVELMALADRGLVNLATVEYSLADANTALQDLNAGRIHGRAVLVP